MSNLNPLYLLETLNINGGQVSHKMARKLKGNKFSRVVGNYARTMKDDGNSASRHLARARKTTGVRQQKHMDYANADVMFGRANKAEINGDQRLADRLDNRAMDFYNRAIH